MAEPTHSVPYHIMDAFKRAFGMGGPKVKSPITEHYDDMEKEDPEDFQHQTTSPLGLPGPGSPAGSKTSSLHPKLQMLMAKLSPSQEEEPEEESQFSPSRLSGGMG